MDIRQASASEVDELVGLLDRAFSWPRAPCLDFRRMLPHLLHPGRIADHLIGVEQGRIIACVGVYPFPITLDGVGLRGAAIGQVATAPEQRDQGRMAAMLDAAIDRLTALEVELAWLDGDRRRYGAYGWASGGATLHYSLVAHDLPAPPDPSAVVRMSAEALVEALVDQRPRLASQLGCPPFELALLVRARGYVGLRTGDAWLVHSGQGDRVLFGEGEVDELGRLFAHLIATRPTRPGFAPALGVECADPPSALDRACRQFHHGVLRRPSCLWRIGKLVDVLARAAQMAAARVGSGSDTLSLINTDTGEAATLECRRGQLSVRGGVETRAYAADTRALSELCVAERAIEYALPDLAADSPLRRVLPIRAHLSGLVPY